MINYSISFFSLAFRLKKTPTDNSDTAFYKIFLLQKKRQCADKQFHTRFFHRYNNKMRYIFVSSCLFHHFVVIFSSMYSAPVIHVFLKARSQLNNIQLLSKPLTKSFLLVNDTASSVYFISLLRQIRLQSYRDNCI